MGQSRHLEIDPLEECNRSPTQSCTPTERGRVRQVRRRRHPLQLFWRQGNMMDLSPMIVHKGLLILRVFEARLSGMRKLRLCLRSNIPLMGRLDIVERNSKLEQYPEKLNNSSTVITTDLDQLPTHNRCSHKQKYLLPAFYSEICTTGIYFQGPLRWRESIKLSGRPFPTGPWRPRPLALSASGFEASPAALLSRHNDRCLSHRLPPGEVTEYPHSRFWHTQ